MTDAMAALGIAVAATSAICYALLNRAEMIRRNRGQTGDNPTDGASTAGSDDWAVASWFGGDHSATDSSGNRAISAAAATVVAVGMEVAAAIEAIGRSGKTLGF